MTIVPFQSGPTEYSILIVLDQNNINRILQRDPACVMVEKLPRIWRKRKLKDVVVCYGTKQDMEAFAERVQAKDMIGALKILMPQAVPPQNLENQ
jgi:hypothetical protein